MIQDMTFLPEMMNLTEPGTRLFLLDHRGTLCTMEPIHKEILHPIFIDQFLSEVVLVMN